MSALAGGGGRPLIFGTDGVRDRPGHGLLTFEAIERLARATAHVLGDRRAFPEDFPLAEGDTVLIARDTRSSGAGIAGALGEAFVHHGFNVANVGILPTPGAAFLAHRWRHRVRLGVVVSASHNPSEYNGIKFLGPTGAKISTEFEEAVSGAFWASKAPPESSVRGRVESREDEALALYQGHLIHACRMPARLNGCRLVLDNANGATCRVAPEVFRRLGLHVETLGDEPDGHNINENCGTLNPKACAAKVVETGARLGFAFDGDGDRMIPCTAGGSVLDGDHVLFLAGKCYLRRQELPLRCVVATVMSNIGLEIALRREGIALLRTAVGDRNVYLAMVEKGHPVGGEQSGHVIFIHDLRTGDGILAALRLLDALESETLDLQAEAAAMTRYPQVLRNVSVPEKRPLQNLPLVASAIEMARKNLGGDGRVLVRYSGTEPLLRVMIEGPTADMVEDMSDRICRCIRESFETELSAPRDGE